MTGVPIHLEMDDHWGSPYDHGNPQMSLWETFDLFQLFQHPHFNLCGDSFTSMVETVDFLPIFVTALYQNPSDGIYIQEDLTLTCRKVRTAGSFEFFARVFFTIELWVVDDC